MIKFLLQLVIMFFVLYLEDMLIYKHIRKVDKKARKKIDTEELNTYKQELALKKEIEKNDNNISLN